MAKTSIRLKHASSIWSVVEKWADENNYAPEEPGETSRLYLQKSADAGTTIRIAISQADEIVSIEAWYSDLLRKELAIDSTSLYAALPRKQASAELRNLLAALGAIPPDKAEPKKKASTAFKLGRSIRKLSGKK